MRLWLYLTLVVNSIILLAFLGYGGYTASEQTASLTKNLENDTRNMARNISAGSANDLLLANFDKIENRLLRQVTLGSVLELVVADNNGRILVQVERGSNGQPRAVYEHVSQPLDLSQSEVRTPAIYTLLFPIERGQRLGWVRVTTSLSDLEAVRRQIWASALLASLLTIVLTGGLLAVFLRKATAALGHATEFAGNLIHQRGVTIPTISRIVEIQQLRRALNSAAQALATQFLALQNSESEQQRISEMLRKSGREATSIQFALDQHSMVGITDLLGNITYVNDLFSEISGYSRQELLGKNHRIINSGNHPPEFFADLWQTITQGKVWHGEICNRNRSGGLYWVNSTIVPLPGADGLPEQYIAIRTDISALKAVKAEAQRFGDLLRGSIDALDEAFVIYDPQDRLVLCNDKYREIYSEVAHLMVPGAQFEDVIRAGAEMGAYDAAIGRVDEWVAERLAIHLAANTTLIQKHSNGRTLRIVERRLPDGHIVGFRIDLSESERAQDEILRLNASLGERVQELHSQQEKLRQSNEELEEKNELLADQRVEVEYKNREIEAAKLKLEERAEQLALTSKYKSEFLSSMSHELRTPLNSLLILSQLLAENAEHNMSAQQIEYAKTIQGAGKDLLALINEILDLSKIESGTVTPDLQDVSFANVREQVERTFRHVAQSRGLGFGVELAPSLPPSLYTDSQRLQQVMKNLLSNAFKFTEKGQVSVRIEPVESGWSVDHDGLNRAQAVLGFFVTDTGIGLSADKQKIIFEAFQQADTGTARKYGGTGLGLSISREIARLLGGELRLSMSEPGQGSTFVLYLPLRVSEPGQNSRGTPGGAPGSGKRQRLERDGESFARKAARPDPAAQEAPQGSMPQETNSGPTAALDDRAAIKPGERTPLIIEDDARFAYILAGKKVLVVDDDVRNIFALTALLERHKMAVIVAESGRAALEELGKNPDVGIVLMDIMMPEMDGYETMRQIRKMKQFESLPMIALTAKAMKGDREKCIEAGASDYVSKPVDTNQLLSLLRVWLYR